MFGIKEMEEKLQRLLDLVEGEDRAVKALERTCSRLEKQNEELFQKLMARNFESYAMAKDIEMGGSGKVEELPFDEDEGTAGEIVEVLSHDT